MRTDAPANYFRVLGEVLAGIQVTDQSGELLRTDSGFERIEALLSRHLPDGCPHRGFGRGKVLLVGNGGSAAIASHVHNDLCKGLGVRALIFNEAPLLTALANDLEYNAAFEKSAELWSEIGDLVFAISSSGQSENILRVARGANRKGCSVVTLSGFSTQNPLRRLGEINLYVPSSNYGHVELAHLTLLHCMTDRMLARRAA